ncbi:lysozyme [Arthrobacter sp. NPDC058288]|uniref:lysozyme n=1 Tax=Arthrobacter sp. NPDC058288 TaxID=3346424 RepID=UPI0036E3030A
MPTFGVQGLDVSGHQTSVNWQQQWNMGARFAYVKASEGNYYTNELFGAQYQGSRSVGMIRGAYHFAIPNWSSGADQARYFVQNGGGWTADGYTLPPVLDFEFNPYEGRTIDGFYFGNTCYGMSPSQLTAWVRDFGNTMQALTGRLPVIYTNTMWWKQCTGDAAGFGNYPLWVAAYPSSATNDAGAIPSSWSSYSIWQYSSTGPFAGDSNVWNGTYQMLQRFATYSDGFGSTFVKGPTSSTIYLVSGKTKYPVPDWATYQLYMNVSSLDQVSQQYVDSLATGNPVGRFARSPDGSIYLIDGGRKYHVPSCTVMYDFGGGSCTGWVPLADSQLAGYSDSGMLANATVSPTGKLFYVSAMTKREFFDVASLSRAGLSSATVSLSDAVTATMPYASAAPVVRPDVIVVDRISRQPYIFTAGKLLAVPTSVYSENVWANGINAAALDPQSIAKLTQGAAFTGFASNEAGSARYVIGSSYKFPMTDTSQWPDTTVKFSDALLDAIGTGSAISNPAYIKSSSSPVVYRRDKSTAREVPDIATLTQLGVGKIPVIYSLTPTTMRTLPKGPAILPLARLTVGDASPMVYLIDGPDKMLQLEDFRITNSLGIGGYSRLPQSALAPYSSTATVQPVIRCATDTYLGYGGGIWKLPATTTTAQLPARTLEASTCMALPAARGNIDTTIFVKALDSPTVYLMVDGTKRPVGTWTRLVELNNGSSSPVIAEYSRTALDAVPIGSPA